MLLQAAVARTCAVACRLAVLGPIVIASTPTAPAAAANAPVWIVVTLRGAAQHEAAMSFRNPSVPDMTLDECRASLQSATPTLLGFIKQSPQLANAEFVKSECVVSEDDPVAPHS